MSKGKRGRPKLSAAEKARRAKERAQMKAEGKVAAKRGRKPGSKMAAGSMKSAIGKLDVSSVVTFANHLIRHEQDIAVAIKGAQNVADWANGVAKQLNELFPKFSEVVENVQKLMASQTSLETRLQKIEDAIDFEESAKPAKKAKSTPKKEIIPNGEVLESEPHN